MGICVHATPTAILCLLFLVTTWADVNEQHNVQHRSSEAVTLKIREETYVFGLKETLKHFSNSLEAIKQDCKLLESALINHRNSLEQLEDNIGEMKAALIKQDSNTRALQEKTASVLDFQKEFEVVVAVFRSELADVKRELVENRNALDQKFVAPLETLNHTVQHITHKTYEDLSQQVAELKAEQQRQASAALETSKNMKKALQDMLQLRENYSSEIALLKAEQQRQASAAFEAFEQSKNMTEALQEILEFKKHYISKAELREKRAISNKCSLNVRHKPEGGRIDLLMVMDPPNIEPAACN